MPPVAGGWSRGGERNAAEPGALTPARCLDAVIIPAAAPRGQPARPLRKGRCSAPVLPERLAMWLA